MSDSLAIACQSLLGAAFGSRNWRQALRTIELALWLGLALGATSAVVLAVLSPWIPAAFTTDPATAEVVAGLLPVIAVTQPLSALAFVLDGVIYGAGGFAVAAKLMLANAAPAVATMLVGCRVLFPDSPELQLASVWAGLAVFMTMRASTIWAVLQRRMPPFQDIPRASSSD